MCGNSIECEVIATLNMIGECVAGLVLARGGSKGIKGKNLLHLDGKPLLKRTLEVMHEAKCKYCYVELCCDNNNDEIYFI